MAQRINVSVSRGSGVHQAPQRALPQMEPVTSTSVHMSTPTSAAATARRSAAAERFQR